MIIFFYNFFTRNRLIRRRVNVTTLISTEVCLTLEERSFKNEQKAGSVFLTLSKRGEREKNIAIERENERYT